jgi:Rrf2 family protein
MRLEVTRRTDLAARALLALDEAEGRLKAGQLAAAIGTTGGFLTQVLSPLVQRRWVDSEPGPTGGYATATDIGALSVLDVVEAVEGPTDTGRCVLENRACEAGGTCALHTAWARARRHLLADLAATPLRPSGPKGARR